jgi:glycerol kinase
MSSATTRAHVARAALDAVAHQICDIADTIPGAISGLRADGGATVSGLLMQTQADLLGRPVQAAEVPEISALGVAELAWTTLGETTGWAARRTFRTFDPDLDATRRGKLRAGWSAAVAATRSV